MHFSTGDCVECGNPVAFASGFWGEGVWVHTGGPWSGEEADVRINHVATPKGELCPCCGRLVA